MSYYLKSNQIKLIIKEEDLSTLKDNTVDFVSLAIILVLVVQLELKV